MNNMMGYVFVSLVIISLMMIMDVKEENVRKRDCFIYLVLCVSMIVTIYNMIILI